VDSIITLLSDAAKEGIIADSTLLLIIIALLGFLYKFFLVPMLDKLKSVPSNAQIKESLKESENNSDLKLEEVSKKLDKMIEVLDEIEDNGDANRRDVKEIRRDIEHIKQILNQFQGHLMYGGGPSHFGNRELK
jgi:hypothetical protein